MLGYANGRCGWLPMCGALQTPFRSILVGNEDEKFSIYGCSPLVVHHFPGPMEKMARQEELYLLHITNSNGHSYTIKFTIQ